MNGTNGTPSVQEFDLSAEDEIQLDVIRFGALEQVIVQIPLPSFGSSNSHIDLCGDLLDAAWALESLAAHCDRLIASIGTGYFKPNITAMLSGPRPTLRPVLADCALLFSSDDVEDLDRIQNNVYDFEDRLHQGSFHVPEIIDWYFVNLMAANFELRSEAPEAYRRQMAMFPERQVGFFRSGYSSTLGNECFASKDGWLLPTDVGVDKFFEATGQKYRSGDFVQGEVLARGGAAIVIAHDLAATFPMHQLYRSQIAAGFVASRNDAAGDTGNFDWLDYPRLGLNESSCLIHPAGTLVILRDGAFQHLIYDSDPLTLPAIKILREQTAETASHLSALAGISPSLACDWASLTDEQFEQLCYDIIFFHPKFDSDTIRKLGKSRSRDGGRDIEVCEVRRWPHERTRKWIFQCKLVKNGVSLGASKVQDVGDMLDQHGAQGFGIMTSTLIDATLYDKIDSLCGKRSVEQLHFSALELERALARDKALKKRHFG